MDKLVNVELISNPANWLIVFVMLTFGAMLLFYVRQALHQ
jgi:hypothetical protein